jgi:hypothetical protein
MRPWQVVGGEGAILPVFRAAVRFRGLRKYFASIWRSSVVDRHPSKLDLGKTAPGAPPSGAAWAVNVTAELA